MTNHSSLLYLLFLLKFSHFLVFSPYSCIILISAVMDLFPPYRKYFLSFQELELLNQSDDHSLLQMDSQPRFPLQAVRYRKTRPMELDVLLDPLAILWIWQVSCLWNSFSYVPKPWNGNSKKMSCWCFHKSSVWNTVKCIFFLPLVNGKVKIFFSILLL